MFLATAVAVAVAVVRDRSVDKYNVVLVQGKRAREKRHQYFLTGACQRYHQRTHTHTHVCISLRQRGRR